MQFPLADRREAFFFHEESYQLSLLFNGGAIELTHTAHSTEDVVCRSEDDILPLAGEDDRCKNEEKCYYLSLSFIAWVRSLCLLLYAKWWCQWVAVA